MVAIRWTYRPSNGWQSKDPPSTFHHRSTITQWSAVGSFRGSSTPTSERSMCFGRVILSPPWAKILLYTRITFHIVSRPPSCRAHCSRHNRHDVIQSVICLAPAKCGGVFFLTNLPSNKPTWIFQPWAFSIVAIDHQAHANESTNKSGWAREFTFALIVKQHFSDHTATLFWAFDSELDETLSNQSWWCIVGCLRTLDMF